MPLHTQILRDGEALQLGWSDFHVAAMGLAATCDDPTREDAKMFKVPTDRPSFGEWKAEFGGPDSPIPEEWVGKGAESYPLVPCPILPSDAWEIANYPMLALTPLNNGRYTLTREHAFVNCRDGEVLRLLPGDVLVAVRH